LCGADSILALDARIVLHDPLLDIKDLPKIAIRPYPNQYVSEVKMGDGSLVIVRPIRPEDEPLMTIFHQDLSSSEVLQRYFSVLQNEKEVSHERLTRICYADYGTEIPLVVESKDVSGKRRIRGVARLNGHHGSDQARFAIVIEDEFQGTGLGKELLKVLIRIGKAENLKRITGTMLPENAAMRHVCEQLGFKLTLDSVNNEWHATMTL
jgi:acetyltransferase